MAAVIVKNGTKRYGCGQFVLNNLNMNVAKGEIYGLLGASGCGKTTILSCVVGLRKMDSGDLIIFGKQHKRTLGHLCGYMPQDLALLNVLTIEEVLRYFGMIYGMANVAIENKIKFLSTFLDLPATNRQIQNLSGGQKRRVSLGVVLIHNPALLVLDEPTVGLDPLLRQRIWEHLIEISRARGTTIIISTHYIEETRRCDKLGFMRGGKLLAENTPQYLLSKYNCDMLEDVALLLCRKDPANVEDIAFKTDDPAKYGDEGVVTAKSYRRLSISLQDNVVMSPPNVETSHTSIISALVTKAWRRQWRDLRLCLMQFVLPIIVLIGFQIILGTEPKTLGVVLVTNDQDLTSNLQLTQSCPFNDTGADECLGNVGICEFMHKFRGNEFNWITAESFETGIRYMHLGKAIALLEFPANFSNHMKTRIVERNFIDNSTIKGSTISVHYDATNPISSAWVLKVTLGKYMEYIQGIASACLSQVSVQPPLKFSAIYGTMESEGFVPYFQTGVLLSLMFALASCTGVVWVMDKKDGLEDRDYAAGVSLGHRMAASLIADSITISLQIVLFVGLLYVAFGMRVEGSPILVIMLVFLSTFCGVCVGWLVATVWNEIIESVIICLTIAILQLFSAGNLFPLESIPWIYRAVVSNWFPLTFPCVALRSIVFRGWGITNYYVGRGFISPIVWGLVATLVCFLVEKRKYRK